ncbi:ABC transporter permease [Kineococcus sp. NPDC059986]|uniref:ABC transporter permease n=1 Tax=Kineococcus sp. NPDC059986 TaxID=3155538 RepID=UPI003450FC3E
MNLLDTAHSAVEAVAGHRLRSLLTTLGILIGIAAVTLTVGLGQGAQERVSEQISALGSNLLIVLPGSSTSTTGVRGGAGSASTLTTRDAAALTDRTDAPDVAAVAPVTSGSATLVAGTTNWRTTLAGTTPSWTAVRDRTLVTGRFFTQAEVDAAAPVVVLGPLTAQDLFPSAASAVGRTVQVDGTPLTVVGVLAPEGTSASGTSQDDTAVLPQTTAAALLGGGARTRISTLYVEATGPAALSAAYQEVDRTLLTLHGVTPATADFTLTSQQALVSTATATAHTLTVLLGGVAGLSLLVGGIGVMNIMLVSVTERVREIGLRKAIGASPSAIRRQFVLEAGLLGVGGGVLGVALGVTGAELLPRVIGQPVDLSATATVAAVGVSLVVGLVAGVYPAHRAARLAPIDALRSQ